MKRLPRCWFSGCSAGAARPRAGGSPIIRASRDPSGAGNRRARAGAARSRADRTTPWPDCVGIRMMVALDSFRSARIWSSVASIGQEAPTGAAIDLPQALIEQGGFRPPRCRRPAAGRAVRRTGRVRKWRHRRHCRETPPATAAAYEADRHVLGQRPSRSGSQDPDDLVCRRRGGGRVQGNGIGCESRSGGAAKGDGARPSPAHGSVLVTPTVSVGSQHARPLGDPTGAGGAKGVSTRQRI